jgi:glycosyltransferase involved in cell wall biosynthesis
VFEGKTVAVVVPAHDEERLVALTIATIPAFVDRIILVDDGSSDATSARARDADPRVELIVHERNEGVGAAIVTGYRRAIEHEVDVACVMAADGQMEPDDLATLVRAVVSGECDYAKANRLFTGQAWNLIPRTRYLGNALLSFLTKIASGYWHVADSQSGYTAVNLETLRLLDLERIYRRYGFPNDMLVHLNVWNRRVRDYPSRPIYGVGERSGIRLRSVVPRISWLLVKAFFWRLGAKYVIRDFHPLVLFYLLGLLLAGGGFLLGLAETALRLAGNPIPVATIVLVALLVVSGVQLLLFAMWFDMESNKELHATSAPSGQIVVPPGARLVWLYEGSEAVAGTSSPAPTALRRRGIPSAAAAPAATTAAPAHTAGTRPSTNVAPDS